ncbi:phosphohistidine phosphatase SixA [Colwellia hornerae]|uniref:Phosphohistidine phosphatase SixA n=1 Tax=Colwellia hornerae TaxID=89402 RepID=A0A5C6QPR5_9GAMM|nr:phosphohistidine phosphatase SixA [Colwellia hornerae]TWX56319.1 phosphohistidine phosphatase SixA [Colwellia hornerae]TWX62170.1 phosphohistidine phosphatase SixA [Colwellia hornerae]TWX70572.1 phosphohistidine phosphatase SixA [Colwellia hornerae]
MRIFVMRHGQAQSIAPSDLSRELTSDGQDEAEIMAKKLVDQKQHFDAIFVSPYVRAQQTAKIVKNILSTATTLTTLEFITPEDSAKQMHNYIDVAFIDNPQANVLIVSHMPLVCYLVEEFTCGQHAPLFETASIAVIDYDISAAKGQLISHTAPTSF